MGAYNPYYVEDKRPKADIITSYCPYFYAISPNKLQSAVLPMISSRKEDEGLKIYDDPRIPNDIREGFRDLETWVDKELSIMSFITVWATSIISVNVLREKNLFAGVNAFDRHVLLMALPFGLAAYPYIREGLKVLHFIDVDELLFENRKNPTLGLYRKRLVEMHTDYVGRKYARDKELLRFDNVNLFEFSKEVQVEEESGEMNRELTAQELEYLARNESNKSNEKNPVT